MMLAYKQEATAKDIVTLILEEELGGQLYDADIHELVFKIIDALEKSGHLEAK